jgi:hypothetical protein
VAKPHRFGQQVMIYSRIRARNGYIPAVNKKGLVLQSFQKKKFNITSAYSIHSIFVIAVDFLFLFAHSYYSKY